jgi:glutaredoxin
MSGGGVVEVTLYGAPDCSLCDDAKRIVEPAAERLGFVLRSVDISSDPELERRYRASIPVVEIDGERVFVYHVSPSLLERRVGVAQARRREGAS